MEIRMGRCIPRMSMVRLSSSLSGAIKVVRVGLSLGCILMACFFWRRGGLEILGSLAFLALGGVGLWLDMMYVIPAKVVFIGEDTLVVRMAVGMVRVPFRRLVGVRQIPFVRCAIEVTYAVEGGAPGRFVFVPSIQYGGVFGRNRVLECLEILIANQ